MDTTYMNEELRQAIQDRYRLRTEDATLEQLLDEIICRRLDLSADPVLTNIAASAQRLRDALTRWEAVCERD
jgi:hypothetical protein